MSVFLLKMIENLKILVKNIEKNDIYYSAEGAKKFLTKKVKNIRGDPYDFFKISARMGGG